MHKFAASFVYMYGLHVLSLFFFDSSSFVRVQLKDNGLLYKDPAELVFLAKTPAEALQYCKDHIAMRPGKIQKLRDRRTYTHGLITGMS